MKNSEGSYQTIQLILLLSMLSKGKEISFSEFCPPVFIAALFTIAKI